MTIDRYTKAVLTIIAVALAIIATRPWLTGVALLDGARPGAAHAQTSVAKYEHALPKAWGKLVGFSNNNLLLEAPDHVLRIVDVEGRAPEYPRIKVMVRWQ